MFANITIDFLLTMDTEVTNVPLFIMVTRVTSAHWVRLLEGTKGFLSEDISCSVLLLDWGDRLHSAACYTGVTVCRLRPAIHRASLNWQLAGQHRSA